MDPIRGISDAERVSLSRQHRAGELHRIRANSYYPADQWKALDDNAKRRIRHMTAADARDGMVLMGRSAALMHGIDIVDVDSRWRDDPDRDPTNDIIELAHPTRRRSTTIRDVRESPLAWGPDDLVRIDGRLVTGAGATVADIRLRHGFRHGLVAADSALRLGHSNIELARAAGRSRDPGSALETIAMASAIAESAAESLARAQFIESGLPAPELQTWVFDERNVLIGRVDMAYRDWPVVIEIHGEDKFTGAYGDPEDRVRREWRREKGLRDVGLDPVRIDWIDMMTETAVRKARAALDRGEKALARGEAFTGSFVRVGERWPEGYRTRKRDYEARRRSS
ncbi:hypothetical protein CJ204_06350 [Corynebacterium xerosis]|uniref:DUF559 domain-containing protein n=1 Tax=Corynebacterium xerosis TaxID=1725 RepID=A0A2N6SZ56_9CORY|nr:hypothetical protein [Corynebacterium xerosis]PMC62330.1 hypothetical protein CJ204_06350 [Corynebacterium xerosis]